MSDRRLEQPLDPDAVRAANEALWARYPKLKRRQLTMEPEDYEYRRFWVDAYLAALGQPPPPPPQRRVDAPDEPCACVTRLILRVTDQRSGAPIEAADVALGRGGQVVRSGLSDERGEMRFDEPGEGMFEGSALKTGFRQGVRTVVVNKCETTEATIVLRPVRQRVIVVAWGPDFEGHDSDGNLTPPGRGFALAAQTKEEEIQRQSAGGGVELAFGHAVPAESKQDFVQLFDDLLAQDLEVVEFHFYSHSGTEDGPVFENHAQFMSAGEVDAIPVPNWSPGAKAFFYGCTSGYGRFLAEFATHQNVVAFGSAGFTTFSSKPDGFDPVDDPQTTPVYLKAFRSMEEIARREYDARDSVGWFEQMTRYVDRFGSSFFGAAPLGMIRMPPRFRPVLYQDYKGRGDVVPVPEPL